MTQNTLSPPLSIIEKMANNSLQTTYETQINEFYYDIVCVILMNECPIRFSMNLFRFLSFSMCRMKMKRVHTNNKSITFWLKQCFSSFLPHVGTIHTKVLSNRRIEQKSNLQFT